MARAKKDLPVKGQTDNLPVEMDMEGDSAKHRQTFGQDMLITPRIKILQDLSPEVKARNAAYIEGAEPGLILNEVLGKMSTSILFAPAKFMVRYIAWQPRVNGGGLVDPNLTEADMDKFEQVGIGSWTGMMETGRERKPTLVEIAETPEWVGIASGFDTVDGAEWGPTPVAISFPSTKVKAARKINTTINLTERPRSDGGVYTPAAFFHLFELSTGLESAGDDEWYGWVVAHKGVGTDANMAGRAKALKEAFDEGTAAVDDQNIER